MMACLLSENFEYIRAIYCFRRSIMTGIVLLGNLFENILVHVWILEKVGRVKAHKSFISLSHYWVERFGWFHSHVNGR